MATNISPAPEELTDQDRLMALLSYIIQVIIPLVVLFTESKERPFQRYHAVQSLGLSGAWVIIWIVFTIVAFCATLVTFGIGGILFACLGFLLVLAELLQAVWYAVLGYQGKYFEIPVVTNFLKTQKWL